MLHRTKTPDAAAASLPDSFLRLPIRLRLRTPYQSRAHRGCPSLHSSPVVLCSTKILRVVCAQDPKTFPVRPYGFCFELKHIIGRGIKNRNTGRSSRLFCFFEVPPGSSMLRKQYPVFLPLHLLPNHGRAPRHVFRSLRAFVRSGCFNSFFVLLCIVSYFSYCRNFQHVSSEGSYSDRTFLFVVVLQSHELKKRKYMFSLLRMLYRMCVQRKLVAPQKTVKMRKTRRQAREHF